MQEVGLNYVPGTVLVEYDNNCLSYFKEEQLDPDSSTYPIGTFSSSSKLLCEGEFQDCAAYSVQKFPSATCKLPCQEEYPGPYEFDLQLNAETSMRNRWLYSQKLKKVYVSMLSKLSIQFKWIQKEAGLRVRALLIYCMEDHFKFPVLRCPNHTSPDVPCNIGFKYVDHIVRCDNDRAEYHRDEDSGRLSVVVPLDVPHAGTDWVTVVYSFVCKNSCPVGMNRRATAIIFTLERPSGEVIGRRKMGVRICSCPKRDKEKEEKDFLKLPGAGNYLPHYTPVPEYDPRADNPDQSGEVEEPTPSEMDCNADFLMDEEATTDNTEEVHGGETENEEESDEGSNSREPDVNSDKYLRVRKDSFLLPPNKRLTKATGAKSADSALAIVKRMVDLASSRDEFVVFGEQVAMKLRNIKDAKVRLLLQHKISNLLFEGEMTNFGVELKQNALSGSELSQSLHQSISTSSYSDSLPSPSCHSSSPQANFYPVSSSRPSPSNNTPLRSKSVEILKNKKDSNLFCVVQPIISRSSSSSAQM